MWNRFNRTSSSSLSILIFFYRNRIWNRLPLSVNGAHLLLKEWSLSATFRDLDFNLFAFWVQIHGLPLCFMTKANAEKI